jgi:ABC-type transporter Mla subunit MlaD
VQHTIELDDDELKLIRSALHAYLDDFGHDEADILRQLKELLAKLPYHERFFEQCSSASSSGISPTP